MERNPFVLLDRNLDRITPSTILVNELEHVCHRANLANPLPDQCRETTINIGLPRGSVNFASVAAMYLSLNNVYCYT